MRPVGSWSFHPPAWTRDRARPVRVVGLMSGTSADGIDAALVEVRGTTPRPDVKLVAFSNHPYPEELREAIFALFSPQTGTVDRICHVNFVLGEAFAEAAIRVVESAGLSMEDVDLIGCAGQTIYHQPKPIPFGPRAIRSTLQIGEACVVAERTEVTTVSNFRARDIAAGGQGAPLVALADHLLFHEEGRTRIIQNIGGIANATVLPRGGRLQDVTAFDTGPGNMIIDALSGIVSGGRMRCDRDGELAARGRVDGELLAELMAHPFIGERPPKTTGREEFGEPFARQLYQRALARGLSPEDAVATATAFTVEAIASHLQRFVEPTWGAIDEVIVTGGGSYNPTLMRMLADRLAPVAVRRLEDIGGIADAKEAVAFALLAYWTVCGLPGNVPAATGARHPVVLGQIAPGRRGWPFRVRP